MVAGSHYVLVIFPVAREGVQVLDDWDGMGQRMTASGSLVLEAVQVHADEVAPRGGGRGTLRGVPNADLRPPFQAIHRDAENLRNRYPAAR